jgi:hypothetical protein
MKTNMHISLSCVLYVCETWSVALGEEHKLRISGNRVLMGIFGSKKAVTRERKKNIK